MHHESYQYALIVYHEYRKAKDKGIWFVVLGKKPVFLRLSFKGDEVPRKVKFRLEAIIKRTYPAT